MDKNCVFYIAKLREYLMNGGAAAIESFTHTLRNNDVIAEEFACNIEAILLRSEHIEFLVDTGIPQNKGFLSEAFSRLIKKFIPAPLDSNKISDAVPTIFPNLLSAQWMAQLPVSFIDATVFTIEEFSESKREIWKYLEKSVLDALEVTATRVFTLSCNPEFVSYLDDLPYKKSIFYKVKISIQELIYFSESKQTSAFNTQMQLCNDTIEQAKKYLSSVIQRMENRGVSVEVVFLVDILSRSLDRIVLFLELVESSQNNQARYKTFGFVSGLLTDFLKKKQLTELLSGNLVLLTRKITEHASRTGEHYIAVTRQDYKEHFKKSVWAGVVTAFTTLFKFLATKSKLAPLFETSLVAGNYASSFLFLQMMGWTLATKQPSMTAASLADALGKNDSSFLGTLVARIFRSQFISVVGNVIAVIPAAILVDFAYYSVSGSHVLTLEKSLYVAHTLDVLSPSTYVMAIITGCLLWMSSIIGGWLENWVIYSRLSDALREHRLAKFFGKKFMHRLAGIVDHHTLGVGSNTSLGVLLAMPALIGRAIGIPMDVRHVTLGAGSLTMASIPLVIANDPIHIHLIFRGLLGLCVIGILNVFVSFGLAFLVALRSRDLNQSSTRRAIKWVLARFIKRPLDFFFPPKPVARDK